MRSTIEINIKEIVGSEYCIAVEDGDKVYSILKKAIDEEYDIILSFDSIDILTSAFLNASIGQIYYDYPTEDLKKHLTLSNNGLKPGFISLIERVIESAIDLKSNPEIDKLVDNLED